MVRTREFVARPAAPAFTVRRVRAVDGPRRNVGPVAPPFAGHAALSGRPPAHGFRAGPGIVAGRGTRLGATAPSAGYRAGMTLVR
jgi:hypothetical protein